MRLREKAVSDPGTPSMELKSRVLFGSICGAITSIVRESYESTIDLPGTIRYESKHTI
jgi:hypothetical protein